MPSATIRSTRGVSGLVTFGNKLVAVPQALVEGLITSADPETHIHTPDPRGLKTGDAVVITAGPLASQRGIFQAADGEERALILLKLIGRETGLKIPLNDVWPDR